MATNLFVLGIAYQAGLMPLKAESIESAIVLNGVSVQQNQQAFRYGRRYVCDHQAVLDLAVPHPKGVAEERAHMQGYLHAQYSTAEGEVYAHLFDRCRHLDDEAQRLLAIRIGELIDYQDVAYATTYVDFVLQVAAREAEACPGHVEITHAAIRHLYKVMAYKDEYEVARLHLRQAWRTQLHGMFAQPRTVYYHFHPPVLRALGLQRKLKLGPWFERPLRLLRKLKTLRGGWCDVFGYTRVRREERQLIAWYRGTLMQVLTHLEPGNHALAVVIANAPDVIRGYEDIKLRRVAETKEFVAQHLTHLTAASKEGVLTTSLTS
jgi:indolepyruvate ferredoxin oxidoreductase